VLSWFLIFLANVVKVLKEMGRAVCFTFFFKYDWKWRGKWRGRAR
jgi:hypothetical protein